MRVEEMESLEVEQSMSMATSLEVGSALSRDRHQLDCLRTIPT